MTDRDKHILKKLLIGGALTGGGIAVGQSLLGYLHDLYRNAAKKDEDDDTLYIDVPKVKEGSVNTGVAMAGGALSGLAAYALARRIAMELRKKQLEKELDEAQRQSLVLMGERAKSAAEDGKPLSGLETAMSAPVALALLTMLASGGVSYAALNKTFPALKKPHRIAPRRVKVRVVDPDAPDDIEKTASVPVYGDPAWEVVVKLACMMPGAPGGELADLIHAAADGEFESLEKQALDHGVEAALASADGASRTPVSVRERSLAATLLLKSAALAPTVRLLSFVELQDGAPALMKAASNIPPSALEPLDGVLAVQGLALRKAAFAGMFGGAEEEPGEEPGEQEAETEARAALLKMLSHVRGEDEDKDDPRISAEDYLMSSRAGGTQEGVSSDEAPEDDERALEGAVSF